MQHAITHGSTAIGTHGSSGPAWIAIRSVAPIHSTAHAPSQRTWAVRLLRVPRVASVCIRCLAIRSWRSPRRRSRSVVRPHRPSGSGTEVRHGPGRGAMRVGAASISDTTFQPAPAGPLARSHDREPGARGRRRGQARQQRHPRREADREDRRAGGQARQEAGRGRVGQGRRHEWRERGPGRSPRGHRRGRRRQRHQGGSRGPGHRRADLAAPPGAHPAALRPGGRDRVHRPDDQEDHDRGVGRARTSRSASASRPSSSTASPRAPPMSIRAGWSSTRTAPWSASCAARCTS